MSGCWLPQGLSTQLEPHYAYHRLDLHRCASHPEARVCTSATPPICRYQRMPSNAVLSQLRTQVVISKNECNLWVCAGTGVAPSSVNYEGFCKHLMINGANIRTSLSLRDATLFLVRGSLNLLFPEDMLKRPRRKLIHHLRCFTLCYAVEVSIGSWVNFNSLTINELCKLCFEPVSLLLSLT